jgi:hypothetical protein
VIFCGQVELIKTQNIYIVGAAPEELSVAFVVTPKWTSLIRGASTLYEQPKTSSIAPLLRHRPVILNVWVARGRISRSSERRPHLICWRNTDRFSGRDTGPNDVARRPLQVLTYMEVIHTIDVILVADIERGPRTRELMTRENRAGFSDRILTILGSPKPIATSPAVARNVAPRVDTVEQIVGR